MGVAVKRLKKMSREESMQFIEMYKEKARMEREADREAEIEAGFDRGVEKGIQQGIQEGIQQGVQKGREQGIQEGQRKLILNMLKEDMDIQTVSKVTGLSKDELLKLREEKQ